MWNKLMAVMIFALVLFVAPWPVNGDGLSAGGARLYYLFSSDQVEERLRSVSLRLRFREDATDLELVVVVRSAGVRFADGVIQLKASTAAKSELPEYREFSFLLRRKTRSPPTGSPFWSTRRPETTASSSTEASWNGTSISPLSPISSSEASSLPGA